MVMPPLPQWEKIVAYITSDFNVATHRRSAERSDESPSHRKWRGRGRRLEDLGRGRGAARRGLRPGL